MKDWVVNTYMYDGHRLGTRSNKTEKVKNEGFETHA